MFVLENSKDFTPYSEIGLLKSIEESLHGGKLDTKYEFDANIRKKVGNLDLQLKSLSAR